MIGKQPSGIKIMRKLMGFNRNETPFLLVQMFTFPAKDACWSDTNFVLFLKHPMLTAVVRKLTNTNKEGKPIILRNADRTAARSE